MSTTTASIDTYTATCDAACIDIVHRDGNYTILIDTLPTSPIRDERELADPLRTYLAGA
jgi:hypothetical protein